MCSNNIQLYTFAISAKFSVWHHCTCVIMYVCLFELDEYFRSQMILKLRPNYAKTEAITLESFSYLKSFISLSPVFRLFIFIDNIIRNGSNRNEQNPILSLVCVCCVHSFFGGCSVCASSKCVYVDDETKNKRWRRYWFWPYIWRRAVAKQQHTQSDTYKQCCCCKHSLSVCCYFLLCRIC